MKPALFFIIFLAVSISKAEPKCEQKTPDDCAKLGKEVQKDNRFEDAIKIYGKGCEFGSSLSCIKLGSLHERMKNKPAAKDAYQKACEIKKEDPCRNVKLLEKAK